MPKISIETQQKHIRDFSAILSGYKLYADTLKGVLEEAVNLYAPLGVVQTRAKTIPSFSEKIIRKDKYVKPLEEVTDLCGARLICHFSSQVEKISEFIRKNFEVDELNSLDVKSRLNVGEFGYRSIHYIVTPRQAKILGIEIPKELWTLKAEIQVRTFSEHIWADIFHDRLYKAPIQIPKEWQREAARLAALLENADNSFLRMSNIIDQLTINYLPTPVPDKVKCEIEILNTLIDIHDKISDKTALSRLKLAQLYLLQGMWGDAVVALNPVLEDIAQLENEIVKCRILYESGFALCYINKSNPKSVDFQKGLEQIKTGIKLLENEKSERDLAKAWFYLGKVVKLRDATTNPKVRFAFDKAHQNASDNPYYYICFLIEEMFSSSPNSDIDLDLFSSRLRKCVSDCSEHVEMGIEVVQALFTIVKAAILLNDSDLALNTYIKAIDIIIHNTFIYSGEQIKEDINDIERIASTLKEAGNCVVSLGNLLLWLKYRDIEALDSLRLLVNSSSELHEEIIIVSGYGTQSKAIMNSFAPFMQQILMDFNGTLISGGTNSGIPGLVGVEAGKLAMKREKYFNLLGYHPKTLHNGIKEETNYDTHITSKNDFFSFFDVLKYWIDILFADKKPEHILLTGFGGGAISLMEYKFALAMGIKVAILIDSGGATSELIQDNYWNKKENLLVVPNDPFTFWALANRNKKTVLTNNEIELLAKQVHNYYRKITMQWYNAESDNVNQYKTIMDWELLDPKLKVSNIKQAEFIEQLLRMVGLKIQKSENPALFEINEKFEGYQLLAQLEHSRWNAERLLSGWKLGVKKDIANKISPYIKHWDLLDKNTKDFDFNAVGKFPIMLMEVGYEIINYIR